MSATIVIPSSFDTTSNNPLPEGSLMPDLLMTGLISARPSLCRRQ